MIGAMSNPPLAPRQPEALYCVTGWPLAQSLSPLLHNTGFRVLGIPAVYMRFAVRPEDFARFMDAARPRAVPSAKGWVCDAACNLATAFSAMPSGKTWV